MEKRIAANLKFEIRNRKFIGVSTGWLLRKEGVTVAFLLLGLFGVAAAESPELCVLSGRTMGTTFTVKFVADATLTREQEREKIETEINSTLTKINQQMSTYLPDSELSLFNQCGHTNWFPASSEVVEVFRLARSISESSGGAFDITVGPLVNLWGFGPDKRQWQVPKAGEIARLLPGVGYSKVSFRMSPPSLRKDVPGIYCDLSAIAKGYGVDRAAEYLESIHVENYLVQIGGELRARGQNPAGKLWRVGIQHPKNPDAIYRTIPLRDQSVSTSGDYVQYFEQDGQRYSHTIDPRTGRPITHNVASVTVVHAASALADGWATALNVLGPDEGYKLALQQNLPALILLRTADGFTEKMTPAFKDLTADQSLP